jgi:hypothetical protein
MNRNKGPTQADPSLRRCNGQPAKMAACLQGRTGVAISELKNQPKDPIDVANAHPRSRMEEAFFGTTGIDGPSDNQVWNVVEHIVCVSSRTSRGFHHADRWHRQTPRRLLNHTWCKVWHIPPAHNNTVSPKNINGHEDLRTGRVGKVLLGPSMSGGIHLSPRSTYRENGSKTSADPSCPGSDPTKNIPLQAIEVSHPADFLE